MARREMNVRLVLYEPSSFIMISERQAQVYCCEDITKIVGYSKAIFSPNVWVCHHLLENKGYSRDELTAKGLYYKRPAKELVFLPEKIHRKLHFKLLRPESLKSDVWKQRLADAHKGKTLSEEHRKKIQESCINTYKDNSELRKKCSSFLGRTHTEETKLKQRESALNRTAEWYARAATTTSAVEQEEVRLYRKYQQEGGNLKWSAWRHFNKLKKEGKL